MSRGWHRESHRHYLAAKGISTYNYKKVVNYPIEIAWRMRAKHAMPGDMTPHRTEKFMRELEESMRKKGFTEPIPATEKDIQAGVLQEGKHRLNIAKKLGLTEVPVELDLGYSDDDYDDIKEYLAVKWNTQTMLKSGGHITSMSPDEYLRLIGDDPNKPGYVEQQGGISFRGEGGTQNIPISEFAEKMKTGEIIPVPPAYVKNQYGTYEQEGRHRAIAAKLAGEEIIPVVFNQPGNQISPDIAEEFIKRIHAVGGYDDEWRKRFNSGSPGLNMDSPHLKLYADILKKKGVLYPVEWDEGELEPWMK